VNPWELTQQEIDIELPGELDDVDLETIRDMERVIQRKLVEWLKGQLWEYTGKTKDMRINKATWRALCESLGVAP
jgi:hypothetical protein